MIKINGVSHVLSNPGLCAGDWVEVKSREEILATLDHDGSLDGMPFMPEMLPYCGKRFRVLSRAHKTCDFSEGMQARRVTSAVHLDDLRCTGEAHGHCQAECRLFWKEAWLRRVDGPHSRRVNGTASQALSVTRPRCTEAQLHAATVAAPGPDPVYSCQGLCITKFSSPLGASELDQYVEAYVSKNVKLRQMFAPLIFRMYARLVWSKLGQSGIPQRAYDLFQKLRGGVPYPLRPGLIPQGSKTPVGDKLHLQPGEFVRVKSFDAIRATVNVESKNRGLLFSQEMVPYCGHIFRVHSRVSRILDERTGKMLHFGNDCIILENAICRGRYNAGLAFCPRGNYPYWREIWLERVSPAEVPAEVRAATPCGASV